MVKKKYILYDGRAMFEDTDECSVSVTADSKEEAIEESNNWPEDYVWYEYDVEEFKGYIKQVKKSDGELTNETLWKTCGDALQGDY